MRVLLLLADSRKQKGEKRASLFLSFRGGFGVLVVEFCQILVASSCPRLEIFSFELENEKELLNLVIK